VIERPPRKSALTSSSEDRAGSQHARKRYRSLRQRLVLANAVLLFAACLLTALVLAPRKFASPELDEVGILVLALGLVTVVNVAVVHRFLAPLQALTALARRVDLGKPGQRVPDARPTSETGELAVTFNEMLTRLEIERRDAARRIVDAH